MALVLVGCSCDSETPSNGNTNTVVPKLSIESVELFEGNEGFTNFDFIVSLSAKATEEVKVSYQIDEFSANNNDLQAEDGDLTFAVGEDEKVIRVQVVADTEKEGNEQFKVKLTNPVNAEISIGDAVGNIIDDDEFTDSQGVGYITPISYEGYDLVWNDEFIGTNINTNNWTHELGDHGWGNNELQNYTSHSDNSYLEDGKLIIQAQKESDGSYTSARIVTMNKQEFTFGRIDIRAIVPNGQGIWPALWMLGANFPEIGWPACGEMDIMEHVGFEPNKIHGTAHYGAPGQGFSYFKGDEYALPAGEVYQDEYHVFSLIWEENQIKWYMDDNLFYTFNVSDVDGENYPFNQDFFFIMNVAVGGNWPGNPDASTSFPQKMFVDYIRVFQKI